MTMHQTPQRLKTHPTPGKINSFLPWLTTGPTKHQQLIKTVPRLNMSWGQALRPYLQEFDHVVNLYNWVVFCFDCNNGTTVNSNKLGTRNDVGVDRQLTCALIADVKKFRNLVSDNYGDEEHNLLIKCKDHVSRKENHKKNGDPHHHVALECKVSNMVHSNKLDP
jgi:hypothetical protein